MNKIRSGDSELVAAKNSSWIHPGYHGRLELKGAAEPNGKGTIEQSQPFAIPMLPVPGVIPLIKRAT
jgi:hypothetical protein